jgi:hypothetical protein
MLSIALAFNAQAQTPYSLTTSTYSQDFNTLDSSTTNSMNFPAGWGIFEKGTSASVNQQYRSGTGSSNAGDCYSFGSAVSIDRALGSITSINLQARFGFKLTNNTTVPLTSATITFTGEQWRTGDTLMKLDSLLFSYSTTATGVEDTITANAWITDTMANMLNSPNPTGVGGTPALSGFSLDGNASANRVVKTITLTGFNVPIGANITFRWYDWGIGGSDDGLSIDDITFAFNGVVVLPVVPLLISTNPVDNFTLVSPSLTTFTASFDNPITVGTGNFTVKNLTDVTNVVIPNANISTSGNNATITGISLLPGKNYAVQYDSTLFQNQGIKCLGIYNDVLWNFATMPSANSTIVKNNTSLQASSLTTNCVLTFNSNLQENATIEVISIDGKVVLNQQVKTVVGKNTVTLNTASLSNGLYIIQLKQQNEIGTTKFVK